MSNQQETGQQTNNDSVSDVPPPESFTGSIRHRYPFAGYFFTLVKQSPFSGNTLRALFKRDVDWDYRAHRSMELPAPLYGPESAPVLIRQYADLRSDQFEMFWTDAISEMAPQQGAIRIEHHDLVPEGFGQSAEIAIIGRTVQHQDSPQAFWSWLDQFMLSDRDVSDAYNALTKIDTNVTPAEAKNAVAARGYAGTISNDRERFKQAVYRDDLSVDTEPTTTDGRRQISEGCVVFVNGEYVPATPHKIKSAIRQSI